MFKIIRRVINVLNKYNANYINLISILGRQERNVLCKEGSIETGTPDLSISETYDDIYCISLKPESIRKCFRECQCITCLPGQQKTNICTATNQGFCQDCVKGKYNIEVTQSIFYIYSYVYHKFFID